MEPEVKRRRFSSNVTSVKKEINVQWQRCGDGFDDLLLNIPKRKAFTPNNNSENLMRENYNRRKSLSGEIIRVSSCPINPIFLELSYKVLYFQQMPYKSYIFNKNSNFCQ